MGGVWRERGVWRSSVSMRFGRELEDVPRIKATCPLRGLAHVSHHSGQVCWPGRHRRTCVTISKGERSDLDGCGKAISMDEDEAGRGQKMGEAVSPDGRGGVEVDRRGTAKSKDCTQAQSGLGRVTARAPGGKSARHRRELAPRILLRLARRATGRLTPRCSSSNGGDGGFRGLRH